MSTRGVTNSLSKIRILSANVNGLGSTSKRSEFFLHAEQYQPDVICLSDTRFDEKLERKVRNELDYLPYFSSQTSNRRGVAILIKKNSPIVVINSVKDRFGNFLAIKCKYDSKNFVLACIYGPNEDNPTFFTELFRKIQNFNTPEVLIVGDFTKM